MHLQPAALDGERHTRAVLGGASLIPEQERAVYQLDIDAPILRGLDRAGDPDDAARGLPGIGVGTGPGELSCYDRRRCEFH